MKSGIFTLSWTRFLDSAVTAVFVAVVVGLAGIVQTPGFSLFSADWPSILQSMLNLGFIAFIGQLANNFVSDKEGKVFGKIG